MTSSEIRAELLQQHADLRARIQEARQAAEGQRVDGSRDELRAALLRLAEALRKHNRREEELLREILPTVDAWGPVRAELMLEEHVQEHDAIYETLVDAGAAPDARPLVARLVDALLEHMAREEKTFLTEAVLCDDGIVRDYFGG